MANLRKKYFSIQQNKYVDVPTNINSTETNKPNNVEIIGSINLQPNKNPQINLDFISDLNMTEE